MEDIIIQDRKIHFENPSQIINMGGPWIGDLYLEKKFILSHVIIDNLIYKKLSNKLFFVRYHNPSKWQSENYFTINFLDLSDYSLFEYQKKFDKVFLGDFVSEDDIEIFLAFHNSNREFCKMFNTSQENSRQL